jgi:hypothetical protein
MLRIAVLLVFLLFCVGVTAAPMEVPKRPSGPTEGTKTKYFETLGALVLLKKGTPEATFGITLELRRKLPKGASATAHFENPPNPSEPFAVPIAIGESDNLVIQSPSFDGLYNNRAYLARVNVTDNKGKVISTHEQWIWFSAPDQMIQAFGTRIIQQ